MIRIRGLLAVSCVLLALGTVLVVACGGGSGSKSKTATPAKTGTAALATTTRTPAATGQPTEGGPDAGGVPGATSTRNASLTPPPTTFDRNAAQDTIDALDELHSDLGSLTGNVRKLRGRIRLNGQPTPTLVQPLSQDWFNACCRREMRDVVSDLRHLNRDAQALSTIYADTGHTQGKAVADQITAQLGDLGRALDAASAAPTREDAAASLDDADATIEALRSSFQSAHDCCIYYMRG